MPRSAGARLILVLFITGSVLGALYIAFDPLSIGPKSALDRADLVNNAITSLGLLAAGLWALFTFVLFRSGVTNLEMTIHPQIQPLRSGVRVLMIDVGLRNTGKVVVVAGSMGCRLWLRRLPMNAETGGPSISMVVRRWSKSLTCSATTTRAFPMRSNPALSTTNSARYQ